MILTLCFPHHLIELKKEGSLINLQFHNTAFPYIGALIFSGLISTLLAIKAYNTFNYRKTPFSKYFILIMLSMSLWSVIYAFEVGFIDPQLKFFLARLEYLGIAIVPVAWFLFAAEYSGICEQFVRKYETIFFLIPFFTIFLVLSKFHELYITFSPSPEESLYLIIEHGPLFWVFYAYSIGLIVLGISFFFKQFFSLNMPYKNQSGIILLACCIPLIGNILHIADIGPFKYVDPTPFSFTITGLILFWSIRQYEFLNIIPIARENVVEVMNEGYIVVNLENSIVDMNKAALGLTGKTKKEVLGKNINVLFGDGFDLSENGVCEASFRKEISLKMGFETKFFTLSISSLKNWETSEGKLILIHDITEIHQYQEALKQANNKIHLMSSITRHDILNQVNVLSGYAELIAETLSPELKNDSRIGKYLKNLNKSIEIIHNQIIFTKDYQELGVVSPIWQSVSDVAKEAAIAFSGQGLRFSIEESGLEVYADPLFRKVFYNLFDNSNTHGECVTEISVRSQMIDGNLVIEISDNGKGIPFLMKEAIFEKSVGKNTGLGLFLVREILSITGVKIKETGAEKKGARFEITVPPGNWRGGIAK